MNRRSRTQHPKPATAGTAVEAYTAVARQVGLDSREQLIAMLDPLLADLITLRDLYTKHLWQASGPTFLQLHRLFEEHRSQLDELIDQVGERVRILGGFSIAMGADAAELTRIPRPPRTQESTSSQISRLLDAHAIVIRSTQAGAVLADDHGDLGTKDLLVSGVLRVNEMQVWFLDEHQAGEAPSPHSGGRHRHPIPGNPEQEIP